MENSHLYDDIIDLPHHVSERHPQMPMLDRAAQFSPFAALTGYGDAVVETARLTDSRRELTEEQKLEIGRQLELLSRQPEACPAATVTFFEHDARKEGGVYRTVTGPIRRVDAGPGALELADGREIPFDDILRLEPV